MKCWSYCSHGGVCVLDAGHEDLHNSNYCTWSDAESISREAADRILMSNGPQGVLLATMWDLAEAMDPDE